MGQNYAYVISSKEGKVNCISEKVCVEVGEVLSGDIVRLDEKDLAVPVEISAAIEDGHYKAVRPQVGIAHGGAVLGVRWRPRGWRGKLPAHCSILGGL